MKGFVAFVALFVVALVVADVSSQENEYPSDVAHGHRTKRSPYDPTLPLILGKSFLLGSLLGPKIFNKGWGWGGHRHYHHGHHGHSHGHGGWGHGHGGGWGGWSSPVVTVSHGWGWH